MHLEIYLNALIALGAERDVVEIEGQLPALLRCK